MSSLRSIYFNPLPSCEGRRVTAAAAIQALQISIHSPHARGDSVSVSHRHRPPHFNPLPSCEGRQNGAQAILESVNISIHSPHARGDSAGRPRGRKRKDFNPLPSCEGRRAPPGPSASCPCDFNPLPSCEGRQHKPPKIHPDLCQPTQQNHDTPLFEALQAPFCGAEPDIRSAKPTGKP